VLIVVVSNYFRKIVFPFQGGITIVGEHEFLPNSLQVTGSIPMIDGSSHSLQNVRVDLLKYPALMGPFSLPPLSNLVEVAIVETCNMISSIPRTSEHFVSMDHQQLLPRSPI